MKIKALLMILMVATATLSFGFQKDTRSVDKFDEISFGIAGNLYLKIGNSQSLVLEGDQDDLDEIETKVEGGKLKIRRKGNNWGWGSWNSNDINVYITVASLEKISVSGSGKIIGESQISGDELELSVSGSGKMELDINVDELDISISGSGALYLEGSAKSLKSDISGSGKIKGEDLTVDSVRASISGSGSCYISVNKSIDANISGSGRVYYSGNPEHINAKSSGSGKVSKM